MATITIDPATRLERHLKVKTTTSRGVVNYAESSGMLFRGFENLLIGKDPRDAIHITQRVCGVCPTSHAMAASLALEAAAGRRVSDNARIVRNLILGADFLHSHILHFYHLSVPSYVKGPDMPPWTPSYDIDLRFSEQQNQTLVDHYVQALAARRQAHEMGAILGGRLPHTVAYEFGGVTAVPKAEDIAHFREHLDALITFVDSTYLPDVELLGQTYPDYFELGRGYGNLLAFGVFDLNRLGTTKLLARGRVNNGSTEVLRVYHSAIVEQVSRSWYDDSTTGLELFDGVTSPAPDKSGAYSWLKAPRYGRAAYETGPLARMWVTGDYRRGISVMDRHMARALETRKIANAMRDWLGQLDLALPFFTPMDVPLAGSGVGLTEAPRGALGHWISLEGGVLSRYQILTPTCWNCSPRDDRNALGPLERALLGTPVANANKPTEVLRVIHSYDPCLACAVH